MKSKQISIFVICLMVMQIIAQPFIHMVEAATYDKEANASLKLSVEGGDGSQKDVDKDFVYQLDLSTFGLEGGHKDAKIIVKLPPEVEYVRHGKIGGTDAVYDKETHSVIYTFKDFLPNGDSKAVPITVKFPKGTKDGTKATAVADFVSDQGGKTSNKVTVIAHEKEVPPEPPKKPEWEMRKTPDKWTIKPGEEVEYTIRAKHVSGPTTLDSLSIKDILPKEAQFISASDNGKYDANSHTVVWDLQNVEGEKFVKVKVKFPEENFGEDQNQQVLNMVEAKLKPKGERELTKQTHAYVEVSNKKPPVIPPEQAFSDLNKAAAKSEYSKDEEIEFTLYNIKNQYSKEIDNFVLQDDRFDERLRFTRMHTGAFIGVSEYKLLYKTKNNSEWKEWKVIGGNTNGEWLDVSSLPLAEGDKVTGIRYEFGKVPANFEMRSGAWLYFKVDDPNFKEGTLKNTAHISYDIDGKNYIKDATAQVKVKENPEPRVTFKKKALTKPGEKYTKGEEVEFELTGKVDGRSTPLKQPIIVDWLPKGLEYVPGSEKFTIVKEEWDRKPYDAKKVKVEAIPNYKEKGRTLLRWTFPELDVPARDAVTVKFKVKVNNFAMAGKLYNGAGLMSNVSTIKSAEDGWGQPTGKDENDLDGDGDTKDPIIESKDAIDIEEEQSLKSIKYVKGELDDSWKGSPEVATTVPGGEVKYRLQIENGGTVAVRNGVLIDIFPAEGDQSVLQTKNHVQERGSKWTPYLTSPIQLTDGDFIKIYYTTVSKPKRDDLIQGNDVFVNPEGANDPNWSLEPPADLTKVTAVKFEFAKDKLVYPGEAATLEWTMRAPVDMDASAGIAWNSFGYSAINDVTGNWIQPAEPNRVGVQLKASKKSSLGDYIWLDKNKDGIQNDGNTGVNGVVVELLDKDGKVISMTRTGNDKKGNPGYYKFVNLDPGEYQVRFTLPDGYKWTKKNAGNDEKLDSNVDKDGYSETIKLGEDEHNMTIDAGLVEDTVDFGELEVTKVEKGSNTPLEGAVFEVQSKDGQVIQTITTGKDGKARATDLPISEYKLVEVKAPKGYKLSDKSYAFEIMKDTKTPVEITFENELLDKGSVEITKVDKGSNKALAGVMFEVQDEEGKTVRAVTTDENGKATISDLSIGKYKLVEVKGLPGYKELKEPVSFEIIKGMKEVLSLVVKNELLDTGIIEITKVDATDSNLKLKNAVFQILDKDGKEVGKLTTDEKGKAISDQLLFGKYTIKEVQAPDGYMLLRDPIEVEVGSPVQKITVENTKSEWVIPNTGGIGTAIFYLIGTILMVITLLLFFRKRSSN